jgi:Na+/H+ antiporter NhaC
VLLVVLGVFPILGKMKLAEKRAQDGVTIPPQSSATAEDEAKELETSRKTKLGYFVFPLVVLLASTVYFDFDALKGAMIANFFTFFYFLADRALSLRQLSDAVLKGFTTILFPIILVILAFAMKLVNDDLQLVSYVVSHVQPYMSRELFPAIAFLTLATIAFLTSTSWDLYVIAIPLMVPLAQSLHVDVFLAVAVVTCAGAFGSGTGFFSDSTILCASSTECPPMVHALTQLPYALMVLIFSTLGFAVVGTLMA